MPGPRRIARLVTGALLATSTPAGADGFDPRSPVEVVVGDPPGPAPSERVDGRRRGQTRHSLPLRPEERWRRELPGGLDVSPVVAPGGDLVVTLSTPDLLRIDPSGRQRWRRKLGEVSVTTSPVITSDGAVVVVTGDGVAWKVSAGGGPRWRRSLPLRTRRTLSAPLAREDGSVVIAGERGVAILDAEGQLRATAVLPTRPAGGLIPWGTGVLVPLVDGRVARWVPPRRPEVLGTFGGQLLEAGVTLASRRTLVAVVDRRQVVAFDLVRRVATPLITVDVSTTTLDGHLTLDAEDILWASGTAGQLWGIDAAGAIARRAALEPPPRPTTGAALFARVETAPSPALVADEAGTMAFARVTGKVGVVGKGGEVVVADARFCGRPLAVLPAGAARFYVACRSGSIALYGEGGGTPSP